jgi:anti-sigma regulatory factor (Ser/Thr protein kinase)
MKPITVPGTLDALEIISNYVMEAASLAELSEYATYRLRLAVDEIATNIVLHGYRKSGLKGHIRLKAEITASQVIITFEDTAIPYDPRLKPPPEDLHSPIEERQIGGLGVYLTMETVDEFHYEYTEGRNRNQLIVNRVDKPTA